MYVCDSEPYSNIARTIWLCSCSRLLTVMDLLEKSGKRDRKADEAWLKRRRQSGEEEAEASRTLARMGQWINAPTMLTLTRTRRGESSRKRNIMVRMQPKELAFITVEEQAPLGSLELEDMKQAVDGGVTARHESCVICEFKMLQRVRS